MNFVVTWRQMCTNNSVRVDLYKALCKTSNIRSTTAIHCTNVFSKIATNNISKDFRKQWNTRKHPYIPDMCVVPHACNNQVFSVPASLCSCVDWCVAYLVFNTTGRFFS